MANPTFLSDGHQPRRTDPRWAIQQKILGALIDNSGGGVTTTGGLVGVVDPEGVVTADPGTPYTNSANLTFWTKASGNGNAGWIQFV